MLENLRDTPPINARIKKPSNILPPSERRLKQPIQPSSSHPNSIHLTKNFTERDIVIRRQLTPYKATKAKSTSGNESPERSTVIQKIQIYQIYQIYKIYQISNLSKYRSFLRSTS